ncbi:PTS sugar transporter subunit IIB [Enterococcus sp. LJL99]
MRTIGLFCVAGLSTALLVNELKKALNHLDKEYSIKSAPFSEVFMLGENYDFILLAPQVRFNQEKVTLTFPKKKIILISQEEFINQDINSIVDKIIFSENN